MTDILRAKKKDDSLEVRLPNSTKQAFMTRCRTEGRSASEALREFIEGQVAPPIAPPKRPARYWMIGAGVAVLGSIAAPSLARPTVSQHFRAMDADGDRFVTTADLVRLDANSDGRVTVSEFTRAHRNPDRP